MAFVLICTATLTSSLTFSTETIDYTQRRVLIQAALRSSIDEIKTNCLSSLPADGTTTSTITVSASKTVTITKTLTQISGKNVTQVVVTATWPESKGSRTFNDTMTFEVYLRGPDAG